MKLKRSRTTKDDNDEETQSTHSSLPNEIIMYDILTRVPIDSLMRFRYVCKQWKDLIKDPMFVDLYSRRSSNPPPGFIFYRPKKRSCFQFFYINNKQRRTYWSPTKYDCLRDKDIDILDSLNGLLLISCFDRRSIYHKSYFVFNPITGCCSEKLPGLVYDYHVTFHKSHKTRFCLAYDSIIAKYKVVCFVYHCPYNTDRVGQLEHFCKILTLGEDKSWRDVVVPKPHNYYLYRGRCPGPVYANGYVYVMVSMEMEEANRLICFDVNRESFNTRCLPKYKHRRHDVIALLDMTRSLCFVHNDLHSCIKLWVLKEEDLDNNDKDEEHDRWREECSIDTRNIKERGLQVSKHCTPFAVLKHPESTELFFSDLDGENSDKDEHFHYVYWSYDKEVKQVEVLLRQSGTWQWGFRLHFHLNSLAYF